VCTCFNVAEPDILAARASCTGTPEQQLGQLQERLKCGTNCGSCIPELKRLLRQPPVTA
jgi:assimilatory nitrate reductase catalytic subunit